MAQVYFKQLREKYFKFFCLYMENIILPKAAESKWQSLRLKTSIFKIFPVEYRFGEECLLTADIWCDARNKDAWRDPGPL